MEAILNTINNETKATRIVPRSKLHHLICTIGVEVPAQKILLRPIDTIAELEAINKQDARVITKLSN